MMPLTCVPTSTSVTGSMVPVAVTKFEMSCRDTVAVSYSTSCFFPLPEKAQTATPATTTAAAEVRMIFFLSIRDILFDV